MSIFDFRFSIVANREGEPLDEPFSSIGSAGVLPSQESAKTFHRLAYDSHMRGLIHIHSKYSSDGKLELSSLKELCVQRGLQFIFLTEHAEDMNPGKMVRFVDECDQLSDESFCFIPGLEFPCDDDLHILGLGICCLLEERQPSAGRLIKNIQRLGGLAILAHPSRNGFRLDIDTLANLDGIEIWNAAYDGKFAPRLQSFKLLRELRRRNEAIKAYAGLDLHYTFQLAPITICTEEDNLKPLELTAAFRAGDYYIKRAPIYRIEPTTICPPMHWKVICCVANWIYNITPIFVRLARMGLRRLGISAPSRVKNMLRYILG